MAVKRPRGTNDFLPGTVEKWHKVEALFRETCREYGYGEARTPIFEPTELFSRGVGDTTDIVEKEMYTFTDRGGRSLTLRPENTASVVRAYLENNLVNEAQPQKLYYVGPMFRYDKPQAGRYRQFHQVGAEALGAESPIADAEIILLVIAFLRKVGVVMGGPGNLRLVINSLGCPECRPAHTELLKQYFTDKKDQLCEDCQRRLDRNPLRILDCKNEKCSAVAEKAPSILHCLCDECKDHFEQVKSYLDTVGVDYEVSQKMVRGLDYYTRTTFEFISDALGAQSTVCGGGRYDGLSEQIGGKRSPGVGFALGVERLILIADTIGAKLPGRDITEVFVAALGESAVIPSFALVQQLRDKGIAADQDFFGRRLKGQMKQANRLSAKYVVMIGDNELETGNLMIRDMETGEQSECPLAEVPDKMSELLAE